jgi:hypothetical protein
MTIESNRRRMRRYMRNHNGWRWYPWHWPSWGWNPRVTVIREYDHYHHRRNMYMWLVALVVILILTGLITFTYTNIKK